MLNVMCLDRKLLQMLVTHPLFFKSGKDPQNGLFTFGLFQAVKWMYWLKREEFRLWNKWFRSWISVSVGTNWNRPLPDRIMTALRLCHVFKADLGVERVKGRSLINKWITRWTSFWFFEHEICVSSELTYMCWAEAAKVFYAVLEM